MKRTGERESSKNRHQYSEQVLFLKKIDFERPLLAESV